MFSDFDRTAMRRALALAGRGAGKTSPNPMVGAIVARNGRIIGEGWHRCHGEAHAEEAAFLDAQSKGGKLAGADLYCTLEPCAFTAPDKKRPPCSELIIKSGIRRVVLASGDPNPKVNGAGIKALREAGISVEVGLLAEKEAALNRGFRTFHRQGRPFVHVKIAQSADGCIAAASGDARWISCEHSRKAVHRMRAFYDAVLAGRGCVRADDPEFTVRLVRGRNPYRVILDTSLSAPRTAKVFQVSANGSGKTIVFCRADADPARIAFLQNRGVTVRPLEIEPGEEAEKGLPLAKVLAVLGETGIRSVLVEGGAAIFGSFLKSGLWDSLSVFVAPLILGGGTGAVAGFAPSFVSGGIPLPAPSVRRSGRDLLLEYNRITQSHNKGGEFCLPE